MNAPLRRISNLKYGGCASAETARRPSSTYKAHTAYGRTNLSYIALNKPVVLYKYKQVYKSTGQARGQVRLPTLASFARLDWTQQITTTGS
jgi:hypothetical protein